MKETEFKDWTRDLLTCITRFYKAEQGIKKWMEQGGGNMEVFTYLNIKGNSSIGLPEHPYLHWSKEERQCFDQAFGKPLEVPKNLLSSMTIAEFLKIISERRDFMRECLSMTPNSQFRNYTKGKKNARNTTNEGQVHTGRKNSRTARNYSKRTPDKRGVSKRRGGSYNSGRKKPSSKRKNYKRN